MLKIKKTIAAYFSFAFVRISTVGTGTFCIKTKYVILCFRWYHTATSSLPSLSQNNISNCKHRDSAEYIHCLCNAKSLFCFLAECHCFRWVKSRNYSTVTILWPPHSALSVARLGKALPHALQVINPLLFASTVRSTSTIRPFFPVCWNIPDPDRRKLTTARSAYDVQVNRQQQYIFPSELRLPTPYAGGARESLNRD